MSESQAVLLGRHPIFDQDLEILGYELLYRDSKDNNANFLNPELASYRVLDCTIAAIAEEEFAHAKSAFINITAPLLQDRHIFALSKEKFVFKLDHLEEISAEHVAIIKEYVEAGFQFCLDNFRPDETDASLIQLMHYVRLDQQQVCLARIEQQLELLASFNTQLIVAKIESQAQFDALAAKGVAGFQGYFFCQPQVIEGKTIDTNTVSVIALLAEINDGNTDMTRLEELIIQDPGLSYKIVRLTNSAMFNLQRKIESIKEAIILLGTDRIRSLASVAVVTSASHKPNELITHLLVRARMLSDLGSQLYLAEPDRLFTIGYFSGLDALFDIPIQQIINSLNLHEEINQALLEDSNIIGNLLHLIIDYEYAAWNNFASRREKNPDLFELSDAAFVLSYCEAVKWANELGYIDDDHYES